MPREPALTDTPPERPTRSSRWRAALRRLRPRGTRFFDLLDQHAQLCSEALKTLTLLLGEPTDAAGRVRQIETLEKRADAVVDAIHEALRRTILPPLPAVVIHELANALDDVIDLTEDCAESMHLYHIQQVRPEAVQLAELAVDCAQRLCEAVGHLADSRQAGAIVALCQQINDLEAQADHVQRAAISRLFREEADAREIIRLKVVYEQLEGLTDTCKDAAHVLRSIVLKYG
jgi:uncharacterized protein